MSGAPRAPAAALLRPALVPFVGEEMLQGGEEEGAETTAFAGCVPEIIFLKQLSKESLGEVFGIVMSGSASADEGMEGIPVSQA